VVKEEFVPFVKSVVSVLR